jgi:chromosome partitioning protein
MKTISVLNFKGGVGKTTFTACIAQALALLGNRVLAVDNDYQYNLTIMLGQTVDKPTIRDVYLSNVGTGGRNLADAIRPTEVANLELVPSSPALRNDDVKDTFQLKKAMTYAMLASRFDYVLIDNSPGLDHLQQAALHAADLVFVPTELSHFAISGIYEMHREMTQKFGGDVPITKIVPSFYRGTKIHDAYLMALNKLFPGKVCSSPIPYDSVFEGLAENRKVLFLHRLSSKAADGYLSVVKELFDLDPWAVRPAIEQKRAARMREEALDNLEKARAATRAKQMI